MTIEVRPTASDEHRAAAGVMAIALLSPPPSDEAWERSRASWDETVSFSAWDADRCVGHAGQFPVETTVPGGARLETGAISRVGVLPTHRRRGIASELMAMLIRDAADRRQTLLSLRASETTIYGRYGFGVAGDMAEATLDARTARPLRGRAADGTMRLLDTEEIVDTVASLYERIAHRRPGVVTRPPSWNVRYTKAAVEQTAAAFVAVHTDPDGVDDGYVSYEVKWNESPDDVDGGTGTVRELRAATDAVELALWRYLLDLDLISKWKLQARPVDDLIRDAADDRRAYQYVWIDDEQWLRLIDVDAALRGRTYRPASDTVTIAVTDPMLPGNDGTWRVGADGAERVDAEPDLRTDIASLSAAYLGGTSWWTLAAVGTVTARDDRAIESADTLFTSRPLPHCGSFF